MFKKSKKEQPHDDTQPPTSQTTSQQNAQPQQPAQPKPPPLPLPQESIKSIPEQHSPPLSSTPSNLPIQEFKSDPTPTRKPRDPSNAPSPHRRSTTRTRRATEPPESADGDQRRSRAGANKHTEPYEEHRSRSRSQKRQTVAGGGGRKQAEESNAGDPEKEDPDDGAEARLRRLQHRVATLQNEVSRLRMQLVEQNGKEREKATMSPKSPKQQLPSPPVDEQVSRLENLNSRLRNQLLQSRKENEFLQRRIEQGQDAHLLQKLTDDVHFLRARCDALDRDNASLRLVTDRQAKQLVLYQRELEGRAGRTGLQHGDVHVVPLPGQPGEDRDVTRQEAPLVSSPKQAQQQHQGNLGGATKRRAARRRTGTGVSLGDADSGDEGAGDKKTLPGKIGSGHAGGVREEQVAPGVSVTVPTPAPIQVQVQLQAGAGAAKGQSGGAVVTGQVAVAPPVQQEKKGMFGKKK